jgi:RHH-type proline utilization regulon transcriptional repressor/proline dehydrogenase/delta 1-pyrroline-5-carboxylate dehydrogenase
VGNVYVNRNIVGAVVGVQPFGGEGLSGTAPRREAALSLPAALGCPPDPRSRSCVRSTSRRSRSAPHLPADARGLRGAASVGAHGPSRPCAACDRLAAFSPAGAKVLLPGPTGDATPTPSCRARGCSAWPPMPATTPRSSRSCLPPEPRDLGAIGVHAPPRGRAAAAGARCDRDGGCAVVSSGAEFDAVLHHGDTDDRRACSRASPHARARS